ncbi:MAG: hypothetical protein ACI31M_03555 [Bacilli bacterium]
MPYTAFNARKSYIEDNKNVIKKFTKAINRGLEYTQNNSSEDIAKVIQNQFPDSSLNELTTIVTRYKEADSWLNNTFISEESFRNLEKVMIDSDLLDDYVPYNDLINNNYSE